VQLVGTPEFPGNLLANGQVITAAAFMIVRDSYTTIDYFLHEHVWISITQMGFFRQSNPHESSFSKLAVRPPFLGNLGQST
jgi:uncharacterized membrane protein